MGNFTLEPLEEFDAVAQAHLAGVGPIDFYRTEFAKGQAALFAAVFEGKRVGSVMLRDESKPDDNRELVVVAAFAEAPRSVLFDGKRIIERMARKNGFKSLRCHTDRPGLAVQFMKAGAEAVLTWEVPHG